MANSVSEVAESVVSAKLSRTSVLSGSLGSECRTVVGRKSNEKVSDSTTNLSRLEKLALPRKVLLEATLSQFEHCFKPEMVDRLKTKIVQQGGEHTSRESLKMQTSRGNLKSQRIYNDLQSRLRKVAFDTLAKRIIEKLPELIVQMDRTNMEQVPQDTRVLNDTLFATVVEYLGKPKTEHEKKTFQQLSFGLTKFVETIIDDVRSEKDASSKQKGNSTISLLKGFN